MGGVGVPVTRWAGLAGALTLGVAWSPAVAGWAGAPFTAHMVRHMLLIAVAAPLVAAAVAGTRWDPVRRAPRLFAPLPVAALAIPAIWAWHVPALHHAAALRSGVFAVEQATFLLSGLWLWLAVLAGQSSRRTIVALPGLAALALTGAHMTVLGVLLSVSSRVFYSTGPAWASATLLDQQRGGAVMLAATAAASVAGALVLVRRLGQAVARTGLESA